jgi:hypothetical protein
VNWRPNGRIGSRRGGAKTLAPSVTRRQIIGWSAIALGGLTTGSALILSSAFAESNLGNGHADVQVSQRDTDALSTASVLYIATVRKDGNQSTPAPVWFTIAPNHLVLIQTQPTTWKAKRIRRGSPVIVWIGKTKGPAFVGKAEITSDPAVSRQIVTDYPKRYLMARLGIHTPSQEMFDKGEIVAITIRPMRDLPEGFASQPGKPAPRLDAGQ